MMVKVLIYGYATGVFSSRGIARKLEEDVALRMLGAGNFPKHRTICEFRRRHLADLQALFLEVVRKSVTDSFAVPSSATANVTRACWKRKSDGSSRSCSSPNATASAIVCSAASRSSASTSRSARSRSWSSRASGGSCNALAVAGRRSAAPKAAQSPPNFGEKEIRKNSE